MTKKICVHQKAIKKYKDKFDRFMINLEKQIKKDKAFKNVKGNMFCGIITCMKNDINSFLRGNKIKQ
jgi:hypothetical protein